MTIALIIIAMIACLRLEGRRFWCACGSWKPWVSDVTGSHNSNHLADPYSCSHIEHGLGFYLLAWLLTVHPTERVAAAVAAEALFECVENTSWMIERYRKVTISRGYYGDAIANSVGDTLCCMAGAWFASVVPVSACVVLALAIEVGLLITIRDCLLLNIVMLIHPIEWIKRWQNS